MERKIGEIFEYNGEWLQCVEQPKKYDKTVCAICSFQGNGNCELDRCSGTYRSDKKSVIFKKLEKVGEPYELNSHLVQKYRFFHNPAIQVNGICILETINTDKIIEIGIKQNKEDMEDLDKIKVRDYTKVEELNVMEENKLNLKPFDIQKAREGKPVCTRDGRNARIICFDVKGSMYPIIALIEESEGEKLCSYMPNGRSYKNEKECIDNLMMLPEKKEGWANIYRSQIYDTLERATEAYKRTCNDDNYLQTIKIEYEE